MIASDDDGNDDNDEKEDDMTRFLWKIVIVIVCRLYESLQDRFVQGLHKAVAMRDSKSTKNSIKNFRISRSFN